MGINGAAGVKESNRHGEDGAAIARMAIQTGPWHPEPGMADIQLESIAARKRCHAVTGSSVWSPRHTPYKSTPKNGYMAKNVVTSQPGQSISPLAAP